MIPNEGYRSPNIDEAAAAKLSHFLNLKCQVVARIGTT